MAGADEAKAEFIKACEHDRWGEESEAIPSYERALALGLPPEDRLGAMLGLGSSLRNVGRHEEAVATLRAAVAEFPDHAPLRSFLALALHSSGEPDEAVAALLDLVLRHAPLNGYEVALRDYRNSLLKTGAPNKKATVLRRKK